MGQAFGEANTISQQQNQAVSDIAGGIVGLGMDAATFGAGAIGGGGLLGGLKALTGVSGGGGGGFGGGGGGGGGDYGDWG